MPEISFTRDDAREVDTGFGPQRVVAVRVFVDGAPAKHKGRALVFDWPETASDQVIQEHLEHDLRRLGVANVWAVDPADPT